MPAMQQTKKSPDQPGENHVMKYNNCSGTATPRTALTFTSALRRHARANAFPLRYDAARRQNCGPHRPS